MQLAIPRTIPRIIPALIPRHRAVIGGLLISIAAALAFMASSAGDAAPSRTVVVASRDITPGTRISATDLERRSLPIDEELAAHGFATTDELLSATTLAPIGAGELLQRSAIRGSGPSTDEAGFSFPIDREHALDGDLRPGDIVDVLATFGSGLDAETAVLARSVRIAQISATDSSSVAGAGRLVVTAHFTATDQLLEVAHAAQVAALTLVRTTGASPLTGGRTLITSPTLGSPDPTTAPSGLPLGFP